MLPLQGNLSSNNRGANQFRDHSILDDLPNIAEILQGYVNDHVLQRDIPAQILKDHNVRMELRTVQKYMKNFGIMTARRNGLTEKQKASAVELVSLDDPLGRWGARLIQEKLGGKGIHIPRDEIASLRKMQNPDAVVARHPLTRKVHHHGIWSIGPNEAWCVDGHEKLLLAMGIAIWGIIDKYARVELGLWAMPNARMQELPPALYLRVVKNQGGMALTVTGDKGSEVGILISLVTTMRNCFQPFLPEDQLPAFKAVKSVYNITRERGWRPIWEKELGNVAHEYQIGKIEAGYIESDPVHFNISHWLWGKIVQLKLDEIVKESRRHRVRKQKNILLPSGGRRIDFYNNPEGYGGKDRLIPIEPNIIEDLLTKYDRPDLLLFGTKETDFMCGKIFEGLGSPKLSPRVGWAVFSDMVTYYIEKYTRQHELFT